MVRGQARGPSARAPRGRTDELAGGRGGAGRGGTGAGGRHWGRGGRRIFVTSESRSWPISGPTGSRAHPLIPRQPLASSRFGLPVAPVLQEPLDFPNCPMYIPPATRSKTCVSLPPILGSVPARVLLAGDSGCASSRRPRDRVCKHHLQHPRKAPPSFCARNPGVSPKTSLCILLTSS